MRPTDRAWDIYPAINAERAYQDAKYGRPEDRRVCLGDYIRIAIRELEEALNAYNDGETSDALCEVLQAAAVCVACLELYGVVERRVMLPVEGEP